MKKIAILGAGISGLATAWALKDKGALTLFEKSDRVGGWIKTLEHNGSFYELGPRGCRTQGKGESTLALIQDLGLKQELLFASSHAKKRYLWHQGSLHKLPTNPLSLLFSPLFKGSLATLWQERSVEALKVPDETVEDFILRRFDKNIYEHLFDPMVSGIYAGDPSQLSIRSTFPSLHAFEQQYGSVIRGALKAKRKKRSKLPPLFTLKGGMERLPKTLFKKLQEKGVVIRLNTPVISIETKEDHVCINGEPFDEAISTLPSHSTPLSLPKISFASLAVVNFGFHHPINKPKGFGFLVPSKENAEILGITFDSDVFPQNTAPNTTNLTVMLGGARRPDIALKSPAEILTIATQAIEDHLSITSTPSFFNVSVAKNAIPQYKLGHIQNLEEIKNKSPAHLKVIGSSYFGVGVNECIAHAKSFEKKNNTNLI